MRDKMGHLDEISYGDLDQLELNNTLQKIEILYKDGEEKTYNWTIKDGT